jgi:predicted Zn-dependent protease
MNATYYCNGIEYPATIRLDKNRLSIAVRGDHNSNEVFWQYEKIKPGSISRSFAYNDYPPQTLEVLQPAVASNLSAMIAARSRNAQNRRLAPFIKLAAAVILFLVLMYSIVVPWLAGAMANRFPASYEQQLGNQLYAQLKNQFTIDEPATREINRFFQALRVPSPYPIRITVVKENIVNAFALPGGHIVVYDKLLNGIGSYEELAALLSHEAMHVTNRHTVRTMFRQMSSALFLSLLIGDAGAISTIILNNANELKNLSYSRSLETEADTEGASLLAQRGISCNGFVRLFQLLQKQSNEAEPSEWLSSHPDLKKRIRQVAQNKACTSVAPSGNEQLRHLFLQLKTAE